MHRRAASTFSVVFVLVFFLLSAAPALLKAQTPPPIPANHVRIHYFRPDGNYLGWTVYAFGDTTENTSNFSGGPVHGTGRHTFRAFFSVGVTPHPPNAAPILPTATTQHPDPTPFTPPP